MKYVKVCNRYVPIEQWMVELLFKYHNEGGLALTEAEGLLINRFLCCVRSMCCSSCSSQTKCKTFDVIVDQAVDELFEFPVQTQVIDFPLLAQSK